MLEKPIELILKFAKEHLKARQFIELLSVILLMALTFFLLSHPISLVQYLGVSIWLIFSAWYVLATYRKQFKRRAKYALFLVALFGTAIWAFGFKKYYDSSAWRPTHRYDLEFSKSRGGPAIAAFHNVDLAIKVEGPQRYHETGIVYVLDPRHPEPAAYTYDQWYYPPIRTVGEQIEESFRYSGDFREVGMYDSRTSPSTYLLNVYLQALDKFVGDEPKGVVSLRFELVEPANKQLAWSESYIHQEPLQSERMEDLVAALEKNLQAGTNEAITGLDQYFDNHPPK